MKLNLEIMSEDKVIGKYINGQLSVVEDSYYGNLLPLYLARTGQVEYWLEQRAIDRHRVHSRLLKKALRLKSYEDIDAAIAVNAATITDTYWVRERGSRLRYKDVRFGEDYFSELALTGNFTSFALEPGRTPELTNVGSYEKCWKLEDNVWWLYKAGTAYEHFSELFTFKLGTFLGLDMAIYKYDADRKVIKSEDFTQGTRVNFEPMYSIMGDEEDLEGNLKALRRYGEEICYKYLDIIYLDLIVLNMDRHTNNYGLIRDKKSGKVIDMAPNFDNNISLIARGYPASISWNDRFISEFLKMLDLFPRYKYRESARPILTEKVVRDICQLSPVQLDVDVSKIVNICLTNYTKIHSSI